MNKLKLLLIATLIGSTSLFAQGDFEGEIKWGEPMKLKKKESAPIPIGSTTTSFYSRKYEKKKVFVQKYSLQSLKLEKQSELDLTYKDEDLSIVNDFVFANKVVFITTYIDKKAEKQYYFIHELENDSKLGKPKELAVTEWVKIGLMASKRKLAEVEESGSFSFEYIVSEDYQTLMVSYKNKGDYETILFDKNLEEVGRTSMEMPFENFTRTSARLTPSGRYYLVGYEFSKGESSGIIKRETVVRGDYFILIHDAVTGEMETVELDINKDISALAVKVLPDESTVAYGMYSNEGAKGITGAFFQKMDKKYQVEFTTLEEFEEDFITQFWSDRQKKKAEKKKKKLNPKKQEEPSLYSYIMHDLAIKDNGDMVLLGEQYYMYVTSHTYTDANGNSHTTYTYHYIYNDIIAVNCTQNGEVTWKEKVMKRQHSTNDGGYFSSFFTMVQGNNVFLMYNDKEGNMDDAEEATTVKQKRELKKDNVAALISFSDEGETTRKTLFDFEGDLSRNLVPKRCMLMEKNEIFLFAEMGKRMKVLGLLTM